jgi:hypothetical protein
MVRACGVKVIGWTDHWMSLRTCPMINFTYWGLDYQWERSLVSLFKYLRHSELLVSIQRGLELFPRVLLPENVNVGLAAGRASSTPNFLVPPVSAQVDSGYAAKLIGQSVINVAADDLKVVIFDRPDTGGEFDGTCVWPPAAWRSPTPIGR